MPDGCPWTLTDWVKRQRWGSLKSLLRTAHMDVAVIQHLRSGRHEVATAQAVQTLKAKVQAASSGGYWTAAWLLTC